MLVSRSILNLRQNYTSKGIDGSTLHISDMASIRFEPHESLSFEQDDLDVEPPNRTDGMVEEAQCYDSRTNMRKSEFSRDCDIRASSA